MPGWDGAGNFTVTYDFTDDRDTGVKILASRMDQNMTDIMGGIENTLARDGQNAASADIPMGSHKITGLADGTSTNDAVNYGQLQNAVSEYNVWLITNFFL
jgi:hypothetical protein